MTPEQVIAGIWDKWPEQQKVEWLATKVMGWIWHDSKRLWIKRIDEKDREVFQNPYPLLEWSPITDWNHWRQVEERMVAQDKLFV